MFWGSPKEHNLDESHDGQTIKVNVGETINVTLPHSSVDKWGFEWNCNLGDGQTLYHCGDTVPENNVQCLQFEACGNGTEQIKLERKQTPGNGNAVIKNFVVTVEIEGESAEDDDDF